MKYWYVCVWKDDLLQGYVASGGRLSPWANDCKFSSHGAATDAKIANVVMFARATVGHFPYAYTICEGRGP